MGYFRLRNIDENIYYILKILKEWMTNDSMAILGSVSKTIYETIII